VAVGDILVVRDALADAMDCLASEEAGEEEKKGDSLGGEIRRLRPDSTDSKLLELTLQNHGGRCSCVILGSDEML
jgi:hypothetical protein